MKMIYNVIKEKKLSSEEALIVASFETETEANELVKELQLADQSNRYSYFVVSEEDEGELPINIDNVHPMIKE